MLSIYQSAILLIVILIYLVIAIFTIIYYNKNKTLKKIVAHEKYEKTKFFFFEKRIIDVLRIDQKYVNIFIYIERTILLLLIITMFYLFKGLGLAFLGMLITIYFFEDAYKKLLYNAGVSNIAKINNFINFFIPHINSGNSAEQSLLSYIEYSKDIDLADYYYNKDNPNFVLKPHVKQIINIYDIAKYNEEQGINDYTYILNEISKDYAQKQVYYNKFISSMGEVRPTVLSYYVGIPLLIIITFPYTYEFWNSFYGIVLSFVLLGLFITFKFLVYKIQKKVIETIF